MGGDVIISLAAHCRRFLSLWPKDMDVSLGTLEALPVQHRLPVAALKSQSNPRRDWRHQRLFRSITPRLSDGSSCMPPFVLVSGRTIYKSANVCAVLCGW